MLPPVGNICQGISLAPSKSHKTSSFSPSSWPNKRIKSVGQKVTLLSPFSSPKPPRFTRSKKKQTNGLYAIQYRSRRTWSQHCHGQRIENWNHQFARPLFFLDGFGGITFSMQGTLVFIMVAVCCRGWSTTQLSKGDCNQRLARSLMNTFCLPKDAAIYGGNILGERERERATDR